MHTLYRHYDSNGTLLYVGRTNNPPARLANHRSTQDWWMNVASSRYEQFDTLEELKTAEKAAIESEQPLHNVIYAVRKKVQVQAVGDARSSYDEAWLDDLAEALTELYPQDRQVREFLLVHDASRDDSYPTDWWALYGHLIRWMDTSDKPSPGWFAEWLRYVGFFNTRRRNKVLPKRINLSLSCDLTKTRCPLHWEPMPMVDPDLVASYYANEGRSVAR